MNIDYNDFYRLRVDIFKSNDDLFRLVLERVDISTNNAKAFVESKQEYFFNKQQLKDFVKYINEATHDNI